MLFGSCCEVGGAARIVHSDEKVDVDIDVLSSLFKSAGPLHFPFVSNYKSNEMHYETETLSSKSEKDRQEL